MEGLKSKSGRLGQTFTNVLKGQKENISFQQDRVGKMRDQRNKPDRGMTLSRVEKFLQISG